MKNNQDLFEQKSRNNLLKIFLSSFLTISFFYITPIFIKLADKNPCATFCLKIVFFAKSELVWTGLSSPDNLAKSSISLSVIFLSISSVWLCLRSSIKNPCNFLKASSSILFFIVYN